MTDWANLTEGQRIVAAYRAGTIDGDEALAASIDTRLAVAADRIAQLVKHIHDAKLAKASQENEMALAFLQSGLDQPYG